MRLWLGCVIMDKWRVLLPLNEVARCLTTRSPRYAASFGQPQLIDADDCHDYLSEPHDMDRYLVELYKLSELNGRARALRCELLLPPLRNADSRPSVLPPSPQSKPSLAPACARLRTRSCTRSSPTLMRGSRACRTRCSSLDPTRRSRRASCTRCWSALRCVEAHCNFCGALADCANPSRASSFDHSSSKTAISLLTSSSARLPPGGSPSSRARNLQSTGCSRTARSRSTASSPACTRS